MAEMLTGWRAARNNPGCAPILLEGLLQEESCRIFMGFRRGVGAKDGCFRIK